MKRNVCLVQYESDPEPDSEQEHHAREISPQPTKKRKLPALPPSLVPPAPMDNPALHQGRIRTTPHSEGQWAAHVYVPLVLERDASLCKLLKSAVESARTRVPSLHPIGINEADGGCELHISLTRPVYLRTHQRREFKHAIKAIARSHSIFDASFATIAELTNDEKTRTFLVLEVGAGHEQFKAMSDALSPTLLTLRQQTYYQDPRFHASFAWALLDPAFSNVKPGSRVCDSTLSPSPTPGPQPSQSPPPERSSSDEAVTSAQFATIERFPEDLVSVLNKEFGTKLGRGKAGVFRAAELCVRIGKEVTRWKLNA